MSNPQPQPLSHLKMFLKDGCIFIDNSSIEKWVLCPRLFEYTRLRQRTPIGSRIALQCGGAVHKALEARYKAEPAYNEAEMLSALEEAYQSIEVPEGDYRTFEFSSLVIEKYNLRYAVEEFDVFSISDRPAVELPFAFQLGRFPDGTPLIYVGKIDILALHEMGTLIVDHKTTSVLGPTWWMGESVSPQYDGYATAVEECTGQTVNGVLINAIGLRKPTKTGTAIEFDRQIILLDERRKAEWRQNTLEIASRMYADAKAGYFPMHRKNCTTKFGACTHYEVCAIPPDNREMLLMSGSFQDDTWSPLNPIRENANHATTLVSGLSEEARTSLDLPAR